jgi:hypothetical protein
MFTHVRPCLHQASEWLVSHLKAKSPALEVTTLHDPRFANTLELAVSVAALTGGIC